MTLVNAYATVQQVRDQLSDKDARVDEAQLERAISAASRAVDRWCGRRFWADSSAVVLTYRPEESCKAAVDDISSTTDLVVKTDDDNDGVFETTWTIGTDFQLEPLNAAASGTAYAWWDLVAIGSQRFPTHGPRARLQVTARFGWSAVPEQVTDATILKSVALFKRKDAPFGVAGFADFGAVRITRADPDVLDLLRPFQQVMV